jgi:hypothetical protein
MSGIHPRRSDCPAYLAWTLNRVSLTYWRLKDPHVLSPQSKFHFYSAAMSKTAQTHFGQRDKL